MTDPKNRRRSRLLTRGAAAGVLVLTAAGVGTRSRPLHPRAGAPGAGQATRDPGRHPGHRAQAGPALAARLGHLAAYQYFFDAKGNQVGSRPAGTMEWDNREGHKHWHFPDFAQYNLLGADQNLVVRSGGRSSWAAPRTSAR